MNHVSIPIFAQSQEFTLNSILRLTLYLYFHQRLIKKFHNSQLHREIDVAIQDKRFQYLKK